MSTRAKEVSERFGLENLPLSLIEDLLTKVMTLWGSPSVLFAATLGRQATGAGRNIQHQVSTTR